MTTYSAPLEEINFLLNHVLDMNKVARLPGYEEATPDMIDAILAEAARFFGEILAPTNPLADAQGSSLDGTTVIPPAALDGIYRQMVDAGWPALAADPNYGGQGLPQVLSFAVDEMSQSANMGFSLCSLLSRGVITALGKHGSEDQKQAVLPYLVSGEWTGTMNLTEPQAGTDLAAIRSKAVPNGDHYLISGQKIFITWGDHEYTDNIIHLVLARTPDAPEGVKGISLFIVPKFIINEDGSLGDRNDVYCVGLEHKLGIHSSPTCSLAFGDNGGAVGYLVGEENAGLMYMFSMMNHARLSVGLQAVGVSERSYQQAAEFARERVQGAVPGNHNAAIINHPDVRRMLMQMRSVTEGSRALAYSAMAHEDFALKSTDTDEAAYHHRRVDLLTPLVKGWCTEHAMETTSLGVQVHGGMGFIEETGAAQHMRDARILPIYEGTNGIQALDLVGRKIARDKGRAAAELLDEWSVTLEAARAAGDPLTAIANALEAGITDCKASLKILLGGNSSHWETPGAAAYNIMMLMGTTAAGALLTKSAVAALTLNKLNKGNTSFNDNKINTATFFALYIMPRNTAYLAAAKAGPETVMAMDEAAF